MQEQLLKILKKCNITKWRIKTFRSRWKGFKYEPIYEICPHCGNFLYPGDVNENNEVCCSRCKSTDLPKRFLKTVNVEALKFGMAAVERISKAAEGQGLSVIEFLFNPEFARAYMGEYENG